MKTPTQTPLWQSWLRGIFIAFLFVPAIVYGQVNWVKHGAAVMDPGVPGSWDDQLVVPGTVIFQDSVYKMWYSGYDASLMRVGYATSPDGINWTKRSEPVLDLGSTGSWDDTRVYIPIVHATDTMYQMWYVGFDGSNDRTGYATSIDGINWTKDSHNPVMTLGPSGRWDDLGSDAGPVVHDTVFHMICYGFRKVNSTWYARAGYAVSSDGVEWTKSVDPVIDIGTWDTPRVQPNSMLYDGRSSKYLVFYGGGDIFTWRIGYATATDLRGPWVKSGKILDVTPGTWESRTVAFPCVLYDTSSKQYKMWYMGGSAAWAGSIGYATANPNPIRVPADYATIQEAIDVANNGDTVVVSEGTYFENIRFRGKKITVGSQYVLDGDTSHISKTIIDGSHATDADSGSVVYFIDGEDTTSVLSGFTIQGGTGTTYHLQSSWLDCQLRAGGGIFINNAGARLSANVVARNRVVASLAQGGGIMAYGSGATYPFIIIDANEVTDNFVETTGGTAGTNEWAACGGIGLIGVQARVERNMIERDSVVGNIGACGGGMLTEAYFNNKLPQGFISHNTFRANVCKANTEGSIGAGLCIAWTGDYVLSNNVFERNVATSAGTSTGWAEGGGLLINDQGLYEYGRKTLLKNRFVGNSVSNDRLNTGGGIELFKTLCTLSGNEIIDNSVTGAGQGPSGTPGGGGGISFQWTSFRFENNIVMQNKSASDGGGIIVTNVPQSGTEQVLMNNTIVNNHSDGQGAGLRAYNATNLVSANNIFWNDSAGIGADEIAITGSIVGVVHCDVAGGFTGTNNINADPKFVVGDTMFNLQSTSPCIGTGIDSVQLGVTWYHAPACDCDTHLRPKPDNTHPDIGAQEEQVTSPKEGVESVAMPTQFELGQNYPNPFNPTTAISYQLPAVSYVTLKVFDLLGREVATLVNETRYAGSYTVNWDASRLSSGVYFYRLQAGKFVETKRMILMK